MLLVEVIGPLLCLEVVSGNIKITGDTSGERAIIKKCLTSYTNACEEFSQ